MTRLGRGGRPHRSLVQAYFDGGDYRPATWSKTIEQMILTGKGFSIECDPTKRRSVRASVMTTARRQGARVTTKWASGRLWVTEVRE